MIVRTAGALLALCLAGACTTAGPERANGVSEPAAARTGAASAPGAPVPAGTTRTVSAQVATRGPRAVRSRLIKLMMVRAGVLAACGQRPLARRAIWNAMITNRLPPAGGHWSLAELRSALGRSIQYSVQMRNTGRLNCRGGIVVRMVRDTNATYALLRRKYPRIPSAEAIAAGRSRGRTSASGPATSTAKRRLSDLFDAPSRGIQGF